MKALRIILMVLILATTAAQAQSTKIRSVTSLPATCDPGDGVRASDEVALVSGGITKLKICKQTNVWADAGISTFDQLGTGANNSATIQNDTGSSLSPLHIGQIAGSQDWLRPGIPTPTTTAGATSSGSLVASRSEVIEVTYNSDLSHETSPSVFVQTANNAAGCASNCSVTVNTPTLPNGYTGYSVYACEINTGTYPTVPCTTPATLVRLAPCTNITTNCVITTMPSGSVQPPTTNTAWVQPPNVQPGLMPLGAIASFFFPKTDGNYYPLAGLDFSSGSPLPSPDGTFEFWHRVFVNDSGQNLAGATQQGGGCIKNTLFSVCHLSGQTTSWRNYGRPRDRSTQHRLPNQPNL